MGAAVGDTVVGEVVGEAVVPSQRSTTINSSSSALTSRLLAQSLPLRYRVWWHLELLAPIVTIVMTCAVVIRMCKRDKRTVQLFYKSYRSSS